MGLAPVDDPASIAELRAVLWGAGYTADNARDALGIEGEGITPRPPQVPALDRRLGPDTPFATLLRLFLLRLPVDEATAAEALSPLTVDAAARLRILEEDRGLVRATVRLIPWGDLVLASDLASEDAITLPADHVMGVTPSSSRLAHVTVRRPAVAALDVGTGCGVQALLAARHAGSVVATDVTPRALAFTAFNARLNGVSNVETREGALLEPAGNDTFDLVVSNPPFVISPDNAYRFRDGGLPGDGISRAIVEAAAGRLRDGGLAHVLVNWAHPLDGDWSGPLREWVGGAGCDALLLRFDSDDPLDYAAGWNRPLADDPEAHERALARWMAYYERLGIEAIGYGAVVLRRREGRNWVRAEDVPARTIGPAGDHVWRLFAAQDRLVDLERWDALLDEVLALAPGHRLDQALRCVDGTWTVEAAKLRLEDGLRFEASIDAVTGLLLSSLDGRTVLRRAIERTAVRMQRDDVDLGDVTRTALPLVRRMLELGFLVTAGAGAMR